MSTSLTQAARRLLGMALQSHGGHPQTAALLHRHLDRLDEPLRVAIAGRVKAGKSTLLNALVGDLLAPTDAGECTKVVTWFRDGRTPRVVMHPQRGPAVPLTVAREDGALVIDLGSTPAEDLDRVVVDWPSSGLRTLTLIDTPGIASLTAENSRRTLTFLDPDDEAPTEADAVVYLMRHLHTADAQFLESFRDQGVAKAASVNAVAVISRADEIGAGRVDAMFSARAIAQRYRGEPAVRALCQDVVAVAGLLAQTGRTLRQAEYQALAALAAVPREELDRSLLSVDRFLGGEPLPAGPSREQLLRRFGMYGTRLAVSLVRQGTRTADALATELVDRSGLPELQRVLRVQFAERRDVLKARSALLAVESVVRAGGGRTGPLAAELERVLAGAHEFTELRTLGALKAGAVRLPKELVAEAERLLGDAGRSAAARLGLPGDADAGSVRAAAGAAVTRWQHHAANPMLRRGAADACRVVVRTCEGMLVTSGGGSR
ncbi:50S ribosome-binding GTPase [Pseudonocardia hierapolitana]|uniref:50S ribosome-binding GTPase n=1 Tax=Pseudonocardia hierapolitana TaxID=1128676 RepID=A0A561SXB8_9PSEU|nr:dynamin family protein [Pseudonocardia hierapolitana]TWF79481.1 50S ribosome-binding GTPase [Pseudonocardia hierapolitana]